jgi:hypothetical protein
MESSENISLDEYGNSNHFFEDNVRTRPARLYSNGKRTQEILSIVLCVISMTFNTCNICKYCKSHQWPYIPVYVLFGAITADFVSGVVHWIADTWGSVKTPLIGNNIAAFREHHIDPITITRHDFIETNGDSFMLYLPISASMSYMYLAASDERILSWYPVLVCVSFMGFLVTLTNQIHKWSHTRSKLPILVATLQRWHVILPQSHHRIHHVAPHETHFCITTGWLNYPLDAFGVWTKLETFIEHYTGIQPRCDDLRCLKKPD